MAIEHALIVVEGPHDVEFVGRLLRLDGFARVRYESELDGFWQPLVPRAFPHGGDLLKRVPVPSFFARGEHSVAVHSAAREPGSPAIQDQRPPHAVNGRTHYDPATSHNRPSAG